MKGKLFPTKEFSQTTTKYKNQKTFKSIHLKEKNLNNFHQNIRSIFLVYLIPSIKLENENPFSGKFLKQENRNKKSIHFQIINFSVRNYGSIIY